MKKNLRAAFCAIASVALVAACNDKNNGPQNDPDELTTFEISVAVEENQAVLTVVPSDSLAEYFVGILSEDIWAAIGGEEGLADNLVAMSMFTPVEGNALERYADLWWQTKYYAVAFQVTEDGTLSGTPAWKEFYIYRPFVEINPGELTIAPAGVSDNGLYVVGNYNDGENLSSYIYDVRKDSLTIVSGCVLYDVTDDGVAYGTSVNNPVIWNNGEIEVVDMNQPTIESGFYGVSPDGSVAVGYLMDNNYSNKGIVYENGSLAELSITGLNGGAQSGYAAKGIGSNGNIVGYFNNDDPWAEVGCAWTGASHELDIYPEDYMVWNAELLDGGGAFEERFGTVEARISPNGRFYAGGMTLTESWERMPEFAYVFDSEERKMYHVDDDSYNGWRADAVTSAGLVFLSDVSMGISSQPYVYNPFTNQVQTMADWASSEYGYTPDGFDIKGSVVAVSEGCTTIVGDYIDGGAFLTGIWFMPRD